MFQCQLCSGVASDELKVLCGRVVCIACATAISDALPRLKTQPQRRQTICMRLQEHGIRVMPSDTRLVELSSWGVTDEQINGACDIAKESTGRASFGYVFAILRNERERSVKPAPSMEPVAIGVPVRPKEDWERLGFANQADYERWQFAYDKDRRSGRRITEVEHRRNWLSPAI